MIDIKQDDLVACICEGPTEKTIIEMLLDTKQLCFNRNQLLDGKIHLGKYRKSSQFQQDYLTIDYEGKKIVIILVQDRYTHYKITSPYNHQVKETYYLITRPEIEMLMVHAMGWEKEFLKLKNTKPSVFLAGKFSIKSSKLKSDEYIRNFFKQHDLVLAIRKHEQVKKRLNGCHLLFDILCE